MSEQTEPDTRPDKEPDPEPVARQDERPARRGLPGGRPAAVAAVATLILVAVFGVLAVLAAGPPPAGPADAAPQEFSSARAHAHVTRLAVRPHPLGTEDNARVRQYIVDTATAVGAEVRVDSGAAVLADRGNPFNSGVARNVIARLPGTDPGRSGGKALLLVSHYDSVPTGPGAADDAAAVAAMLETMRAVRASGGVPNDLVFLFTDGEELGLLGATQFVAEYGVDDYGAVLNWEARGSSGPIWMFETSPGNHPLVRAFAAGSPRPMANSLAYEVYRRLPNDTDFTVFLGAGATGMNAAFIDGLHDYHSSSDTPRRLNRDSLEHHGQTMLGLVRELGGADLRALRGGADGGDAVYFDLFAGVLVHYPAAIAMPLAVVTALGLVLLLALAARRARLRPVGVLAVTGTGLAAIVLAGLVCFLLWTLIGLLRPDLGALPLSEPYAQGAFGAGFALVALAVLLLAAATLRRRTAAELLGGGLLMFGVLLLGSVFTVPGASYLFQWPLLAGLPALWWTARSGRDGTDLPELVLRLPAPLVAVVLFAPLVLNLVVALGVRLSSVAMVFAVLAAILVLPLLREFPKPSWQAGGALLAGLVVLTASTVSVGFDTELPRPNALVYVRDVAAGKALWLTGDPEPDEWTRTVLGDRPDRADAVTYLPEFAGDPVLTAPAPDLELAPPTVRVLGESTQDDGTRRVRFHVGSQRDAWQLQVRIPRQQVGACAVAGVRLDGDRLHEAADRTGGVVFLHYGGPDGVELTCDVAAGQRLAVEVCDTVIGLPEPAARLVGRRPANTIPVSYGLGPTDSSVVRQVAQI